jgi:pimeloyl-ACP methyl ester carboxylesterase
VSDADLAHLRSVAEISGVSITEVVLPAEGVVVVNGLRLHYLDWGGPAGTPMILVHGGALSAHTWDVVCLSLRDEYRCLALDQRGHGDSDWAPDGDYSLAAYSADIGAFLRARALKRPVLVGMSAGGLACMQYAGAHAAEIAALVLVDCGPEVNRPGAGRIGDFIEPPPRARSLDDYVERARSFNPARDPQLLRHSLRRNLRAHPDGGLIWKWDPAGHTRARAQDMMAWAAALWPAIEATTCPTLVIRGEQSDVLTDAAARRLASRFPAGVLATVENAGHTVQGDNPAGLLREMRAFLGRVIYGDRGANH